MFLFFGMVAVMGTYFVQAGQATALSFWASLPMGFLITAILVVNNLRDIETDRKAGKKTLAVRLGPDGTRLEYLSCLVGAYLVPLLLALTAYVSAWMLLAWISLPYAARQVRTVYREKGRPLNRALGGTGLLTLLYAILLSIGLIL